MRERRLWQDVGLVIVAGMLLGAAGAWAQSYEALAPLLTDLPGWNAEKAQGTDLATPDMKMTNATRTYKQDGKEITVQIMFGGSAGAVANALASTNALQMENAEQKISIKTIAGFQVSSTFNKVEKSGTMMVVLAQGKDNGGFFNFMYKGLADDEALALAQKFDWKKMQEIATGKK